MHATARIALMAATLVAAAIPSAWAQQVLPDRIVLHGSEFIPRFIDLPRVLVVQPAETVTLPPDSTWDAIEVAGTLRVSRTHDTTCRFTHLTILPGGKFDAGTVDDPVLARVDLIVRDVAIDTAKDPFQWGNGIINLGHQTRVGRTLERTWTELTEDAEAGATTIRLEVPAGWQVGDELLLPDTRQIDSTRAPLRREPAITIAAVQGDTITLSRPLTFEHLSVRDPDGEVVLRPRVANLSRNIVIRSENAAGVRGHTVNTGAATWDIRYNRLVGLGRTTAENLDSTEADVDTGQILRIGLNQIARYASHDHHVHAHGSGHGSHTHHAPYHFIGNALEGAGDGKWGHVVHGSHDTHVEENIAVDFVGAGFVTEDGYEVRNVFRRNVAAYSRGNGIGAASNIHERRGRNMPGAEGAGFWFRGLHQAVEENEAWNNAIGFNLFPRQPVRGQLVPSTPGGRPDTPFDPGKTEPVVFARNIAISNVITGLEYWDTKRFPVHAQVAAHNGQRQVFMGQSGAHLWLTDVTLVGAGGTTTAISSSEAYTASVEVDGGRIVGCQYGISRGGARAFVRLRNLVLQNRTNVSFERTRPDESLFENVRHVPLEGHPERYLVLGRGDTWDPRQPLKRVRAGWTPQRGTRHVVVNWQGTGQDYRLFEHQQLRSAPAWPATGAPGSEFYCPAKGLSMGECWDRFGLAYAGGVVATEEAVVLPGVVNGVGRAGADPRLGTPRAVLTTPNMLAPADMNEKGRITLRVILTGDPTHASDIAVLQVDDGAPLRRGDGPGSREDRRIFSTDASAPGMHTVRTWRETPAGKKIPESEMTFHYYVDGDSRIVQRAARSGDMRSRR